MTIRIWSIPHYIGINDAIWLKSWWCIDINWGMTSFNIQLIIGWWQNLYKLFGHRRFFKKCWQAVQINEIFCRTPFSIKLIITPLKTTIYNILLNITIVNVCLSCCTLCDVCNIYNGMADCPQINEVSMNYLYYIFSDWEIKLAEIIYTYLIYCYIYMVMIGRIYLSTMDLLHL